MVWDRKPSPSMTHLCRSSRTLALRRMRSAWVTSWDEAWCRGIQCVIDVSKGNVEHKLMRLLNEIWEYCGFEANSFWALLFSDLSFWIADLKVMLLQTNPWQATYSFTRTISYENNLSPKGSWMFITGRAPPMFLLSTAPVAAFAPNPLAKPQFRAS